MQAAITKAVQEHDGLCLMRGGGPEDSFEVWDDSRLITTLLDCGKPFYTAIGHSKNLTLADRYADESFATPSGFSAAYIHALDVRKKWEDLQSRLEKSDGENQRLKRESAKTKYDESERKIRLLDDVILRFQQLPATLEKQIGFFISTAVKTSIGNNFSQPLETAIKGSIVNLNQAGDSARSSITKLTKVSQFHKWTWLFSIFLLGALVGSFGYHYIAQSKIDSMQEQLRVIQQQTAVTSSAPESILPDGKLTKGHRGR